MALTGVLLLVMALSSGHVRRLPVSPALVYLLVGVFLGPLGLAWLRLDVLAMPHVVERVTEVAVIVALFIGGLKLRLPLRDVAWRAVYRLAGPLMLVGIAGVALVTRLLFGLDWPVCILVGAIAAPTDPVLASSVAVNDARDCDRVRYGLSGEAGLNDGMAFPFIVLALTWMSKGQLGGWVGSWALTRLLWAVPAALGLGYVIGHGVGRLTIWLRTSEPESNAPNDLLIMALICLTYVLAESVGAWGFLAVFAAGVGLRHAEVRVVRTNPHPDHVSAKAEGGTPSSRRAAEHPPAEHLVASKVDAEAVNEPAVAAGVLVAESLSFGETLERVIEFVLVLWVGVALASHWEPAALAVGAALLFAIRPIGAALLLIGTPTSSAQRRLMGWFGVRGIGSLYYLGYALTHGLGGEDARIGAAITLWVTALSVLVHGVTAAPLILRYQKQLRLSGSAG
jgi:NhaP-type Na+/H+ or K+/H+ antiporter